VEEVRDTFVWNATEKAAEFFTPAATTRNIATNTDCLLYAIFMIVASTGSRISKRPIYKNNQHVPVSVSARLIII
jgi:hypothetical protein